MRDAITVILPMLIIGCTVGLGTPEKALLPLADALKNNDTAALQEIFAEPEAAEAFRIFSGQDVAISSHSPAIGHENRMYDYLLKSGDGVSEKPTSVAMSIIEITTDTGTATAFAPLELKKGKWQIVKPTFVYTRYPGSSMSYMDSIYIGVDSIAMRGGTDMLNGMTKIEVFHDDDLICSQTDLTFHSDEDPYFVAECDFSRYCGQYIKLDLVMYQANESFDGVYYGHSC